MRLLGAVLMATLLSGCGLLASFLGGETSGPTDSPHPDGEGTPPAASIDGVPGRAVSWCWGPMCADGVLTEPPQPPIHDPLVLHVAAPTDEIELSVMSADQQTTAQVHIAADGRIGPIPDGHWAYLTAFVQFSAGGDAYYAWGLN